MQNAMMKKQRVGAPPGSTSTPRPVKSGWNNYVPPSPRYFGVNPRRKGLVSSELKGLSKPRSPKIQSSPLCSGKRTTDQIDSTTVVGPARAPASLEDCCSHVEEKPLSAMDSCSNLHYPQNSQLLQLGLASSPSEHLSWEGKAPTAVAHPQIQKENENEKDADGKLGSSKLLEERLLLVEKLLQMEIGNSRNLKGRLEEAERELIETKNQVARSEDLCAQVKSKELQLISAEIVEIRRTLEERDLELGRAHGKVEEFRRKCENANVLLWALGTAQLLTFFTFYFIKWRR